MKKNKLEIILLCSILVFALILRVYALGTAPLWIDEATSSLAAKNILEKGIPLLDSGWLYSGAYVFHYSEAFFLLFGINDFNARFVSVIFGFLTVLLAYFIGKEYSKTGGLISALFMSVFYLEVFFSRQARFYQLFQLMFFLSLYLLYKSKEKPNFIYLALLSFFICISVQIEGLVLAPFFIGHILFFNKPKWLAFIPAIPLFRKFLNVLRITSGSSEVAMNYAGNYFNYARNMHYLLILFVPGLVWGFFKKKRLTCLIILPSLIALAGIFNIQTFALRYSYFFVFPLVLYSSLLISFLYEKYGKIILISLIALLVIPSNLFFPYTYVTILKPTIGYTDYSAPTTDYKNLPFDLVANMRNNTLVSLYSSDVEWYIKKPTYVIPFTMDGRGDDQISRNNSYGGVVDRYSGALILKEKPKEDFYLTADIFSVSKLKPYQQDSFNKLIENCTVSYTSVELKIYYCPGDNSNKVTRVIDGDTFELETGEKVRLICIDTPETGNSGAEEAKEFLESLVLGKSVKLEKDVSETDQYGRLLRYVYVNDIFVNKEIVQKGYGTVFRYGNDTSRCDEIES